MRALLRRVFLHDWWLKLVSLALAVVLFVVVRGDKDAATGTFVKVIYVLPKDRVLVSDPVGELRVSIRGPWTRVSRFDERDLDPVRVDLTAAKSGDFRFSEDMIKLPVGLRVASIAPASVPLKFEAKVERTVPVQPILEGEPAPGFRVARSTASPSLVKVAGAKSAVEAVQRVSTRPLRIAEARGPVRGEVQLESPPPHTLIDGSGQVTVTVEVEQVLQERILRGLPVRVSGLGRLDGEPEPAAADVTLRGPADALAQVAPGTPSLLVDAQAEDSRPPGAWRKRISVAGLPPGVAAEVRPEAVTLVTKRRRD